MEKAINTKTKKVNVIYGFFNNKNYGVHYPLITENFELSMLFPYLNKGEVEITDEYVWNIVYYACKDMKKPRSAYSEKYNIYMQVRTIPYSSTIAVSFRIVENAD